MIILKEPLSFDWNEGNRNKNYQKHNVADQECEDEYRYA